MDNFTSPTVVKFLVRQLLKHPKSVPLMTMVSCLLQQPSELYGHNISVFYRLATTVSWLGHGRLRWVNILRLYICVRMIR